MSNTRLLLSITTNGKKETFSSRGRHGSIDIILWPILNSLWFSGFQIVKPFISYDVVRASDNQRKEILEKASNLSSAFSSSKTFK